MFPITLWNVLKKWLHQIKIIGVIGSYTQITKDVLDYYCLSSFYAFYHSPREVVGCWFLALNATLNKLNLQIACPSNHLNLSRKSAAIPKFWVQIPKDLNQHGIAEKPKRLFKYECFNIGNCIAYLYRK